MIRDHDGPPFPEWPDPGPCPITEAIAEHREQQQLDRERHESDDTRPERTR